MIFMGKKYVIGGKRTFFNACERKMLQIKNINNWFTLDNWKLTTTKISEFDF